MNTEENMIHNTPNGGAPFSTDFAPPERKRKPNFRKICVILPIVSAALLLFELIFSAVYTFPAYSARHSERTGQVDLFGTDFLKSLALMFIPFVVTIYLLLAFFLGAFHDTARNLRNVHIFSLFVLPADLYAMAAMFVLFYPVTDFPCAWDALIALAVVLATICLRVVLAVSFFVDLHRTRKEAKRRKQNGQPTRPEQPSAPAKDDFHKSQHTGEYEI